MLVKTTCLILLFFSFLFRLFHFFRFCRFIIILLFILKHTKYDQTKTENIMIINTKYCRHDHETIFHLIKDSNMFAKNMLSTLLLFYYCCYCVQEKYDHDNAVSTILNKNKPCGDDYKNYVSYEISIIAFIIILLSSSVLLRLILVAVS